MGGHSHFRDLSDSLSIPLFILNGNTTIVVFSRWISNDECQLCYNDDNGKNGYFPFTKEFGFEFFTICKKSSWTRVRDRLGDYSLYLTSITIFLRYIFGHRCIHGY